MTQKKTHPFRTFFAILGGSILAGWFLSVLNIAGAVLGKGSIFQWSDLPTISLWHMIIWSIGGLVLGAGTVLFNSLRKQSPKIYPSGTALLLLYAAFWLYFFGQANIRVLTGLLSLRVLLWNGLMIAGGLALLIVLVRAMRRMSLRFTRATLTSAVFILIAVTLFSTASSLLSSTGGKTGTSRGTDKSEDRINVLFILLDAVRADHLSCYGYEKETTPHIDRLAAGGILFEQAFSQSSHTLESVASYMTSTYPSTHTVRTQTSALPPRIRTLPDLYHADGYATAVFSANPYVSAVYGYGRGVDDFYWPEGNKVKINKTVLGHMLQSAKAVRVLKKPAASLLELGQLFYSKKNTIEGTDPTHLTDKALTWLKDQADHPFFLYLHYDGGHNPYLAPDPSLFDPDYIGPPVTNFPEGLGLFYPAVKGRPLAPEKKRNMIAQYDGQIHYHDANLGRLFEYLNTTGLGENTVVVVTSDHGEEF
ncbi:MAG: sulfatase [Candidatus Aminicenantes bacterium]|nr:sulfatase [Candidatus Aminicenantes bacterium]